VRLRSGKYESFYSSVDPQQITKSLDSFMEDRRRDINRAWQMEESERRRKEDEEHQKLCITFDEYWERLSDEQKADPDNQRLHNIFSKNVGKGDKNCLQRAAESIAKKCVKLLIFSSKSLRI